MDVGRLRARHCAMQAHNADANLRFPQKRPRFGDVIRLERIRELPV
jgi:hypothetical protein